MKFLLFIFSFLSYVAVSFSISAAARGVEGISVNKVIVDFTNTKQQYQDVEITNSGVNNAYVLVEVVEVVDPGMEHEKRVEIKAGSAMGIVATPRKMVILPNGRKLLRIIPLDRSSKKDKIYRVRIKPVLGEGDDKSSESGVKTQLRIMIGYEVLVMVRPLHPQSMLEGKRTGKKITFFNSGNTNVMLRRGKQCKGGVEDNCLELPGKRIYSGMKWTENLPYDLPVEYIYSVSDKINVKVYE